LPKNIEKEDAYFWIGQDGLEALEDEKALKGKQNELRDALENWLNAGQPKDSSGSAEGTGE
jgi:hypothetical protein